MVDIETILDMLDWNMPAETQAKGRELARNTGEIRPFIQPLTPEHSKNVWDNCAAILAEKSDEALAPYLPELLEWLQDMNWPGAFCILDRLHDYADKWAVGKAVAGCVEKAKKEGDEVWESNLGALRDK